MKKMQSIVAVACEAIKVFYVILIKGVDYDPEKMMGDIRRPEFSYYAATIAYDLKEY